MKLCSRCKDFKELSNFYIDARRNKPTSQCKECIKELAAKHTWRKLNPDKEKESRRKSKIKSKYSLTLSDLELIWLSQDKACAICKRPISLNANIKSSKPHIDHCHVTNVVRGLLCLTCNTGLGMFGDSSDLLLAANKYLQKAHLTPVLKECSASVAVSTEFKQN